MAPSTYLLTYAKGILEDYYFNLFIYLFIFMKFVFKSISGKVIYKQITNTINDKHPINYYII